MATYVAFLRAINLGAKRRFGKDDLASVTAVAGPFAEVATYLNTGNVRITTSMRSTVRIEQALEAAYAEFTGFEVPTVVLSVADLAEVVTVAEEVGADHVGQRFVSVLKAQPSPEAVTAIEAMSSDDERVQVRGRAAHLLLGENFQASRINNATVERHLGVATTRSLGVIRKLQEKWG